MCGAQPRESPRVYSCARARVCVYVYVCARSYVAASEGLTAASRRGRTEEVSFEVVSFPRSETATWKELARSRSSLSLSLSPSLPATLKVVRDGVRGPRVLRGLSAHRRAACFSTWIFRSGEGCVNPSPLSSSFPSLSPVVPLYPTPPFASPRPPPLPRRVARSATALPIGADTPRGVEADLSPFGATRPFSAASVRPSVRRASSPSLAIVSRAH